MALLILSLVIIVSLILIVLGLPGLWIMVASAVTYNLIVPGDPIGWVTLVIVGILALVAELLDISLTGRYARRYLSSGSPRVPATACSISSEPWSDFRFRSLAPSLAPLLARSSAHSLRNSLVDRLQVMPLASQKAPLSDASFRPSSRLA